MTRQRGAGLLDALVGLALGLLVLQGLVAALGSALRAAQDQRDALLRREASELLPQVLREVIAVSGSQGQPGPDAAPALRVTVAADAEGDLHLLEARFLAAGPPGAGGACGEAPRSRGGRHSYRLGLDAGGTLRCSVDGEPARPLADRVGRWRLDLLETRGSADAPRLRLVDPSHVRDWRRVSLLRARLITRAPAGAPAQSYWIAPPVLDPPEPR